MTTGNGSNAPGAGNGSGNGAFVRALVQERKARIALVGCGYWGPKVIRAAASLPEIEVAALVDREIGLAAAVQRHFPAARTATSLTEALADETIDAVIVATNPSTHVALASEALE